MELMTVTQLDEIKRAAKALEDALNAGPEWLCVDVDEPKLSAYAVLGDLEPKMMRSGQFSIRICIKPPPQMVYP